MSTKQLISITPLADARVILEINLGTSGHHKTINLKEAMVNNFIRNNIVSRIEDYVKHRNQILSYHGGYVTVRKMQAIQMLQNKLANSERWTLLALARHIHSMREDLICIMPCQGSKFYAGHSAFLSDLHQWATQYINQYNKPYASGTN